jgi:predicted  nucleic acid-binding Zn-ribbon protein
MDEIGTKLLELQRIDSKIVELERQLRAYPGRIRALDSQARHAGRELEAASKRLKETQARRGLLESEIAGAQTSIKKFVAQQMQVKTNKEYQAITHQIGTIEEAIGEQETLVLELLEREDNLGAKVEERKDDVRHTEREANEEKTRLGALEEEKRAELERLRSERSRRFEDLPEDTAMLYENLSARFPGDAIESSDGRTCGGCHMNLLAHTIQLLHESGTLAPCSHCSRLLYLRDS